MPANLFLTIPTIKTYFLKSPEDSMTQNPLDAPDLLRDLGSFWTSGDENPDGWSENERRLREIPQYVLDHAPYVHLYSEEQFWPCDIAEHLVHTSPHLNYTPIEEMADDRTLTNLDELNKFHGRWVFLQSDDNVEKRPNWLGGSKNIPSNSGNSESEDDDDDSIPKPDGGSYEQDKLKDWYDVGDRDVISRGGTRLDPTEPDLLPSKDGNGNLNATDALPTLPSSKDGKRNPHARGGRSTAPAVLIVVPKPNGVLDAFWFYFYSYNLGNVVVWRFGNHVGDWEHTVVRFQHGQPQAVFLSEHSGGQAYSYGAMEKLGGRPVTYSATGTHAMYALPGVHRYILPWGLLSDHTDRGPLWDPALNVHAYTYNASSGALRASTRTPKAPTGWFYFGGHWGDKRYPLRDRRQYFFAGQYHYENGPLGPRFKNLGRGRICQGGGECVVRHWLGPERPVDDSESEGRGGGS
ncbi:hypothetical protein LTR28_006322 [Elasticomyces elasticus]|nr:hypothetical protein LTR28_006322 [Elasticomyces elasticus]